MTYRTSTITGSRSKQNEKQLKLLENVNFYNILNVNLYPGKAKFP